MEGDAGTSRLNPTDADDSSRTTPTAPDQPEAETDAQQSTPATDESAETDSAAAVQEDSEPEAATAERGPSRLGRKWFAAIAVVLVLMAGGLGAGAYFALRYNQERQATARNEAAALKAAVDCVAATQAPDTTAMNAAEQKIIDCGTDAFRSQALLYTSMVVQAYQAANVHVQVSDMRGAVERDNPDGSVDVLVALRVKVANNDSQNETGYRLRVRMSPTEGQYKISKLDQVTK
ncbi:Mce protein [Mycobacterium sp. 1423905.2]|uniref:Mce protein n=1 Tax=Mycobacterium sp. 1423905.2 TaxID=1856859 RepID=UPI0008004814|nr:Mce protein [Mycobacterium sp. 1423905.2]OBJ57366.1 Mce protein [Mycobacterium sp. 1423905.2]